MHAGLHAVQPRCQGWQSLNPSCWKPHQTVQHLVSTHRVATGVRGGRWGVELGHAGGAERDLHRQRRGSCYFCHVLLHAPVRAPQHSAPDLLCSYARAGQQARAAPWAAGRPRLPQQRRALGAQGMPAPSEPLPQSSRPTGTRSAPPTGGVQGRLMAHQPQSSPPGLAAPQPQAPSRSKLLSAARSRRALRRSGRRRGVAEGDADYGAGGLGAVVAWARGCGQVVESGQRGARRIEAGGGVAHAEVASQSMLPSGRAVSWAVFNVEATNSLSFELQHPSCSPIAMHRHVGGGLSAQIKAKAKQRVKARNAHGLEARGHTGAGSYVQLVSKAIKLWHMPGAGAHPTL